MEPAAPSRWRPGGDQVIPRPANWSVADDVEWARPASGPEHVPLAPLLDAVARRGGGRHAIGELEGARHSAVLVALFDGELGAEVVLTRRARHLSSHKGEVSFPGGRTDPGETPAETALREAYEEVQLDPAAVRLVGELDHLSTVVSRSLIVPVVGHLTGRPVLRAGTNEVDRIFTVPLAELMRPDTYRQERWGDHELARAVHFFELDDETVWGATGRILHQLLTIAIAQAL
jgi:mutator protein MutT